MMRKNMKLSIVTLNMAGAIASLFFCLMAIKTIPYNMGNFCSVTLINYEYFLSSMTRKFRLKIHGCMYYLFDYTVLYIQFDYIILYSGDLCAGDICTGATADRTAHRI